MNQKQPSSHVNKGEKLRKVEAKEGFGQVEKYIHEEQQLTNSNKEVVEGNSYSCVLTLLLYKSLYILMTLY